MLWLMLLLFFLVFGVALIVIAIQEVNAAWLKRHPRDPPDA